MEYVIIIILQLLGISFNAMQMIMAFGNKFPNETRKGIIQIFFKEDWDTLIVSGLVLALNLTAQFIFDYYEIPFTKNENYILYAFGTAFVLGYAGQRMIYKYMGTAEKFLDKQVMDKLDKQ